MSTPNITEVVKEKYGQAALRVTTGAGNACCGAAPVERPAASIRSPAILYDAGEKGAMPGRRRAGLARLRQSRRRSPN